MENLDCGTLVKMVLGNKVTLGNLENFCNIHIYKGVFWALTNSYDKLFRESSLRPLPFNYFHKDCPSQKTDGVLNMPLIFRIGSFRKTTPQPCAK